MILTVSNPFASDRKAIQQKKKERTLSYSEGKKPRARTAGAPDSSRRPINIEGFGMMEPTGDRSTLSIGSGAASSSRTQTS